MPDDLASEAEWTAYPKPSADRHNPEYAPMPGVGPLTALRLAIARRDRLEGRASRSEYWWLYLWGYVWILVVGAIVVGALLVSPDLAPPVFVVMWILSAVLMAMSWKPLRAVHERRLRDTGVSRFDYSLLKRFVGWPEWRLYRRGDAVANDFGPGPDLERMAQEREEKRRRRRYG